jgi:hypothetical protein
MAILILIRPAHITGSSLQMSYYDEIRKNMGVRMGEFAVEELKAMAFAMRTLERPWFGIGCKAHSVREYGPIHL